MTTLRPESGDSTVPLLLSDRAKAALASALDIAQEAARKDGNADALVVLLAVKTLLFRLITVRDFMEIVEP